MKHIFDVELAQEIGVNAAILLENLSYWCKKNKANNKYQYEGSTWTYNSIKAFGELFPYLSRSSISNALSTLESLGYIITGNFNKISYDRTKWYSVTEKGLSKIEKCIYSKQKMDLPKTGNGFSQNRKPIPDINPDSKPSLKDSLSLSEKTDSLPDKKIPTVSNQNILTAWNKMASAAGLHTILKITPHRQKHIRSRMEIIKSLRDWKRLFRMISKSDFLCGDNDRDWKCDFDWVIKNDDNPGKVLEGKYTNKEKSAKCKSKNFSCGSGGEHRKYDNSTDVFIDSDTGENFSKGTPEYKEWMKTKENQK